MHTTDKTKKCKNHSRHNQVLLLTHKTSNSNHRLKSAVDMPICVLKRGDLCDCMSSHENEARFLYQNEVNLRD